jgi:hypothetical protein
VSGLPVRRRLRKVKRLATDVVFMPVSSMRSGQVVACSMSLLIAGFLLTRGFIGIVPGRPVFVLLGLGLGVSAVLGLAIDHVEVRARRERPEHVLADEVSRCRRFGHPLSLVAIRCTEPAGRRVVGRTRGTDRAWRHRSTTMVMLPETTPEGAALFVRRVADLVPLEAVRVATFPEDALTVDGLQDALHPIDPASLVAVADGGTGERRAAPALRLAPEPEDRRAAGER